MLLAYDLSTNISSKSSIGSQTCTVNRLVKYVRQSPTNRSRFLSTRIFCVNLSKKSPRNKSCCLRALAVEYAPTQLQQLGKDYLKGERSLQNYPPLHVKADGNIYAIGDLHGDLTKTIMCLKLAKLMKVGSDNRPVWTGGDAVVVQVGDVLDRGDNEISTIMLLRELDRQAREENGAVYMINGNHESLNVCQDYRYVTPGAFIESAVYYGYRNGEELNADNQRYARDQLYKPGGYMANILAQNPTALIVNDTLFVHGGVLPLHVEYGLARLNREVSSWMRGEACTDGSLMPPPFLAMGDQHSVMWNRTYSKEKLNLGQHTKEQTGAMLQKVLDAVCAKRMVVGHTPQIRGCNAEFEGLVWRLDVGMSGGVFDASATVLEISQNEGRTYTSIKTTGALCFDQIDLDYLYR
eukprot:TRINITY_DN2353_c0_g1_i17.p2 TRINITY_DN2353_c0_g1~~TRINITY_DN2353_c0_g1_i17.p2  ORF type:complete len:409 (+),score=41.92 TRINITY_DN2353_c0_g1_i17:315-1541(+)